VIHAGDLFDHWKPSPYLLSKAIQYLPARFYTVAGQHDMPQHSLELMDKSGINVLAVGKHIELLSGGHFGMEPYVCPYLERGGRQIMVWHTLTWSGTRPWPGCEDLSALELLKMYPKADLIVTGDNHQTFVEEYKGRLLVNAGSLMRTTTDQIGHHPCVFLWHADMNTAEPVYLPIMDDVISREHLERKEERDHRIDAFVSKLVEDHDAGLSFEDNLREWAKKNRVRQGVMDIVWKAIDKESV